MAILKADDAFDPDTFTAPVIGIAAKLQRVHDSKMHQHKRAQLLYAPKGCMRVTFADRRLVLTPRQALIIPGGIAHQVNLKGSIDYRSLYFAPGFLPATSTVWALNANPLLRAMIDRIALSPFNTLLLKQGHLVPLLLEEIEASRTTALAISLPRSHDILEKLELYQNNDLMPSLSAFAALCNRHAKTVSRLFVRETGLSYQQWMQQWRFIRSIEYLAKGLSVHQTAMAMAFSSDSAFISFFTRYSGMTPKLYQNNMQYF